MWSEEVYIQAQMYTCTHLHLVSNLLKSGTEGSTVSSVIMIETTMIELEFLFASITKICSTALIGLTNI